MKLFTKIRQSLIKALLRSNDPWTYTGYSEGEPLKFYYQDDTGKYLLGQRSNNWYYFEPTLSAWSAVSSRYLPWGETVENCVFNPATKKMDTCTYYHEPKEVEFRKWLYGIQDNIHEQYVKSLLNMTSEELEEFQKFYKDLEKTK